MEHRPRDSWQKRGGERASRQQDRAEEAASADPAAQLMQKGPGQHITLEHLRVLLVVATSGAFATLDAGGHRQGTSMLGVA